MKARTILCTLLACTLPFICTQCRNKGQDQHSREQATIRDLVRDEENVLEVTVLAQKIGEAIEKRKLINADTRALFAAELSLGDISPAGGPDATVDPAHRITTSEWVVEDRRALSLDEAESVGIWSALLTSLDEVSDASFGFISGTSDDGIVLKSLLKFGATGVDPEKNITSMKGKVAVDWVKSGDSWKIKSWHTKNMTQTSRPSRMFENRMTELFSPAGHELATRSLHEEKLTEFIQNDEVLLPKLEYGPYFQPESSYQHPSVSVIDINGDGWDDLFVTAMWAPCQLWINEEGRHFTEQASAYGLDVSTCCTSAIFADLDNDGDADLVLGRSLERSRILWNENGHFVSSPLELPYLVTSISTADCNNDGLLDIYLCTYGPNGTAAQKNPAWIRQFIPEDEHRQLRSALSEGHRYYNQAGPRNYLLINRGGRKFDLAGADPAIDQYHNSYQGSWADYDQDGDVDLYVCNDFAPDSLLRNEGHGEDGVPQFTDVSKQLSGDTMKGFGMGASWGDYDNDQKPDLFVTNMYSKAGHRVLSRFDNVDDRLHFSARGNLLFRQNRGKFHQLAGESDAFPVNQGGWAFGGQFLDVDNDAWLDLYVPNGFYTAPERVASQVDL